jgi:carbon monoxide dehydrogenase subunit G
MPHAESETVIQRPTAEVFAFLADAENDPKWRSGVVDIARVSGSGVGTRYRQGVRGPGGRRLDADIEITRLEADSLIKFRGTSGPMRPTGQYRLEPAGTGTRVRFILDAELSGLKKMMTPMVQKTMNNEVGQLEDLKRVLEADKP